MTTEKNKGLIFIKTGVGCCEVLLFFGFLIADIWLLLKNNDVRCDQPMPLWIFINLIIWSVTIITGSIPVNSFSINCLLVLSIIGQIGMLIWGYILYFDPGNCVNVMPEIYNLILAHIIVETILIIFGLIILFFAISCCCCVGVLSLMGIKNNNGGNNLLYYYDHEKNYYSSV